MKKYENYVSNLSVLCKAELEDMENEFMQIQKGIEEYYEGNIPQV